MSAPIKWSAADFELANIQSPEGEPWLSAAPDGRFSLAYFETISGPPARLDAEETIYSASGLALTAPSTTISATSDEHQPAVAWLPDRRRVVVWTEEGRGGLGGEDVYARVYFGNDVADLSRFPVPGSGAGRQHDPVVAANGEGFVIAFNDDSVAGGQLFLNFFSIAGSTVASFGGANAPQTVNQLSADLYRDVEIAALADGNYAVVWASDAPYDIWMRVYSATGVALTGAIDVGPGASSEFSPDVTALADGRFLVTYEQYGFNTVRGRIYEANGTPSAGPFTIATDAANALSQQVQSAALNDGRFVTVWRSIAGDIEGQVMFADGTADGAAFAVNGDGAGGKGRPTVATLADGRFAVSWESGAGATATIFTTIFDPREAGLSAAASGLADDWIGTGFTDTIFGAAGNDRVAAAGGNDFLHGEAGQDTLNGDAGDDRLFGGNDNDTLNGGADLDILYGELGNDTLNGDDGEDSLRGGAGNDTLNGGNEDDSIAGEAGNDTANGGLGRDTISGSGGTNTLNGGGGSDLIAGGPNADTIAGGDEDDGGGLGYLRGNNGDDVISGGLGVDRIEGGAGNDRMTGGAGNDTFLGGSGFDIFVFTDDTEGNDRIDDWTAAGDQLEIDASNFGGGLAAGALAANRLVVGAAPVADQAFGQFLYRTTNGQLSWDADGTGAGAAVNLTRLLNGGVAVGTLVVADFDIVA